MTKYSLSTVVLLYCCANFIDCTKPAISLLNTLCVISISRWDQSGNAGNSASTLAKRPLSSRPTV